MLKMFQHLSTNSNFEINTNQDTETSSVFQCCRGLVRFRESIKAIKVSLASKPRRVRSC